LIIFVDTIIGATQELQSNITDKAHTILNNAVMQELEQEIPDSKSAYANIICSHIISCYQHLWVSLFTIETLMTLYNEQNKKNRSN
jgi:hypothetical protein